MQATSTDLDITLERFHRSTVPFTLPFISLCSLLSSALIFLPSSALTSLLHTLFFSIVCSDHGFSSCFTLVRCRKLHRGALA